jgi:hypothetical protein
VVAASRLGAYVDESIHDDHGLYVLAAVLTDSHARERAQDALKAVLPADRLPHWHIEDEATRAKDRLILATLLRDSPRTSYSHVPSASEPLLWVADVVAGAVSASWLRGRDHLRTGLDAVLAACEREPG